MYIIIWVIGIELQYLSKYEVGINQKLETVNFQLKYMYERISTHICTCLALRYVTTPICTIQVLSTL